MLAAILQIIAYLLPLVIDGARQAQAKQKGADHDANIQELRKALNKNNQSAIAADLADQHDRVREALCSDRFR